jgi:DNA repair photolyase
VKPHTFAVLEDLDGRGLENHVLIITRYRITPEDCSRLNALSSIKVTILITYSGIADNRIEPIASDIAVKSLNIAYEHADRYRVILYWRPIVSGLNDSDGDLGRAKELSLRAHATVFTGLF